MSTYTINDVELYYEVIGNPNAKEVIVFLNGVMASTRSWLNQVECFRKLDYRILLHDFKGQLKSDKPQGPYTFHQHAFERRFYEQRLIGQFLDVQFGRELRENVGERRTDPIHDVDG